MSKFIATAISDIHFGAMDADILYDELYFVFIKYLKSLDSLDLIVICGDLFDKKISMNSNHAKKALKFIKDVICVANDKDAQVRVVKGTLSHDNDQLDNLNIFEEFSNFKVIERASSEYFEDKGVDILYIPEEYMEDKEAYYKDLFKPSEPYDLVFGHGVLSEVAFSWAKHATSGPTTNKKVPSFSLREELFPICKGVVTFGHIHVKQRILKRGYYTGSYSRYIFGESEPKGFNMIEYDPLNPQDVKVSFVENTLARVFDTVDVDVIGSKDAEEIFDILEDIINNSKYDKLRVRVNLSKDVESPKLMTSRIKEFASKYPNVVIDVNSSFSEMIKAEASERVNALVEKYGFVFEPDTGVEEKISTFINKKFGKNISVDRIRDLIFGNK